MIKILTVVGARPQFIKAAVLSRLIGSEAYRGGLSQILVHTGQHYDENMSEIFFREMQIPAPDLNLGIGGGGHGKMTGEMLVALEAAIVERRPDLVLVYGDTNSTLAGALAASKLHVPVAHVEAGLRSRDKRMPEEQNRILTDHLSTWLLCPCAGAVENLGVEGIVDGGRDGSRGSGGRGPSSDRPAVNEVGDIMLDASLFYRGLAARRPDSLRFLPGLGLKGAFRLVTLHRAENTDDPRKLAAIVAALNRADDLELVFPLHPRTRKCLEAAGLSLGSHVRLVEPLGFLDMIELEASAACVVTDSGGVQKEAFFFRKPCVTLRESTEWVETLRNGWNQLVGSDTEAIVRAIDATLSFPARAGKGGPGADIEEPYGDGHAGEAILERLLGRA